MHQIELQMQNEELRRTQEVLETSRARYFDLYDLAPVGYFTLSEKGLILEANLTAATALGVSRSMLIKRPLSHWIVSDDQDSYYLYCNRLLETGTQQVCELRMVRQREPLTHFWARLESTLVQHGEDGSPVCRVVMSDITGSKRAEKAIQELAHDLGERVKELNCLYRISSLVETPGITLEEILQGSVGLIPPAWQYPEITCARIRMDGQEYSTDSFAQSPWQQAAEISAHGEPRGTVQVAYLEEREESDEGPFLKEERNLLNVIAGRLGKITERIHAQEQVVQQHQFLQTVLDSLTHPFFVINVEDYTLEVANRAAYGGKLRGDLTCFALLHERGQPCQSADHRCPLQEVVRTKAPVVVDHVHVDSQGRRRHYEVHGFPQFDPEGNVIQLIEYTLDITERKQIEAALSESESRWRSLTETSPDHILMLDTDLIVRFANHASPGLTVDDLIGKPLFTLVDEPRQAEVKSVLEGILQSGVPARYETSYRAPDAGDIYYESYVAPRILPGTGKVVGLTLSARDITERRQTEHALRDSEAKLRALFEMLPVGISVLDRARNIQLANPALARILQLSEEQLEQGAYERRTYLRADETELPPGELPTVRAVRDQQPVRDVEIGIVKQDGERVWTSVSASPLPFDDWQVIVATADITSLKRAEASLQQAHNELEVRVQERTSELKDLNQVLRAEISERKHAEWELRASEERFRELAENIDNVFWINDVADGECLYVSPAYEDLWGQSRETLYGQASAFLEPVHPEDRQRTALILDTAKWEEQVGEVRIVRPDGSLIWVRLRAFPVQDETGQAYRVAGIAEEITEQVQAVQLLEQRVEERTHQLSTLLQIASSITLTLELDELLDMLLDGLRDVAAYDSAIIYDLENKELVALVHRGIGSVGNSSQGPIPLTGSDVARRIVADQGPVLISDIRDRTDDSLLAPHSDWACCGMAVPLRLRQRVVGLLTLYSSQPQSYSWEQTGLVLALANQVAVSIENARLYEQTRALAAVEERQRLSRDLHDAVSQTLFSANIIAEALPRIWERDPVSVRRRLPQLHRLTAGALAEMRTLLLEMRPNALVEVELGELMQQAVDAFSGRSRTVARLSQAGHRPLPGPVQIALYRIAQEALNNVAKHAKATKVWIDLQMEPDGVQLCVQDDGQGFEPDKVPPGGMGLKNLSERAKAVGAQLQITSQPGNGTKVLVAWTETIRGDGEQRCQNQLPRE